MTKHNMNGWRKDREDSRDYDIGRLFAIRKAALLLLPKSFMFDREPYIYDQGNTPECVGFSGAGIKTDEEKLQYNRRYVFDGHWLYNQCKKVDGYPYEEGTEPRIALKIMASKMKRKGFFYLSTSKYKIAAYYRVSASSSIDYVKQIIYQFGSIMIGSWWYDNWMDRFTSFPEPSQYTVGGHAYRIVGWDDRAGFIVVNSWGKKDWGVNGLAYMGYDIFNMVLQEGDAWKVCDAV